MTSTEYRRTALSPVNNDAEPDISVQQPYSVAVRLEGTVSILFHRWSCEAVAEKAAAAKGSKAKKSDNVESYVYRNAASEICIPGRYLIGSLIDPRNGAAKYRQDPRSPRKSALDLYKAGVVALTELAPIHSAAKPKEPAVDWDYLDQQRVMVQRQGITRLRPAFLAGWAAEFELMVLTPEYITNIDLHESLNLAGRLVGLADFRPSYGRFRITTFKVI
jgi:hypothetical protein